MVLAESRNHFFFNPFNCELMFIYLCKRLGDVFVSPVLYR